MNLGEKIKKFYQEAELYNSHGLLPEALEKYRAAEGLIKANKNIKNRNTILKQISIRVSELNKSIEKLNAQDTTKAPKVEKKAQSLMKEMFSFDDPEAKGSSSLGGAVALAKFGQYDKAVEEFNRLLEYDSLRLEAAKNILSCWIQQNYDDYAVTLYQKWAKTNFFPPEEMAVIQDYFNKLMEEHGIEHEIEELETQRTVEPDSEVDDDEILDINSVKFALTRGEKEGERIELEISFQSGKYVRMIIPRKEKGLLDSIKAGDLLKDIDFYSPVAIFSGEGYVSSKSEIDAGPKKGDYSLEIKIIKIVS